MHDASGRPIVAPVRSSLQDRLAAHRQTEKDTVRSCEGKTVKTCRFDDEEEERVDIEFTDGTRLRIVGSEWLQVDVT